jgi:hypothetical protein
MQTSKAIPVTGRGGLQIYEMLRIPQCLGNRLTDGGKVVALCTGRALLHRNILFFACRTLSKLHGLLRPEGLGKFKELIHLIGYRTRDLPSCSIV